MANTHAKVGAMLAAEHYCEGSRMKSVPVISTVAAYQGHFIQAASGISFSTEVVKLVRNIEYGKMELWITGQYFSQSTNRHIEHFCKGFADKYGRDNIYRTRMTEYSRISSILNSRSVNILVTDMQEVNAPRLREPKRRGVITHCLNRATQMHRNLTRHVNATLLDSDYAKTVADIAEVQQFLQAMSEEPDLDAVRAAVTGFVALWKA